MKALLRSRSRFAALALAGICLATAAQAAFAGIGESTSEFLAVGPGGLKIEGKGTGVSVAEAGGTVTVTAAVNALKTGMSLRDDHLKKAINASAHPNATLSVARSALQIPADGQSATAKTKGKFTLNGVTKELDFDYKVNRTGSDFHVQGRTQFDLTQFELEQPCYLGVCVDKTIKVKVAFKVRDN